MKTLHRIRHNINITFANFQACVIFGFLDMGIFTWIADQFIRFWATSGELDDPSLSAAQLGNPTIELQDFLRLAYPYHTLSHTEICYDLDIATAAGWWYRFRLRGGGWSRRVPQHWFFLQSCVFRISKNTHLKLKYLNENFTDWRGGLVVWLGFLKIFLSRQINP